MWGVFQTQGAACTKAQGRTEQVFQGTAGGQVQEGTLKMWAGSRRVPVL